MIRYHDERGHLPGRRRSAGRHRYFDQADVDWLSALQALLAAGIPTAIAVRAMREEATSEEQARIESALGLLGGHLAVARERLTPAQHRYELGFEDRMTLAWDIFVMRTRMESFMFTVLHPTGVIPGEFGLLSLVAEAELTPTVLAQIVGVAPSTLTRRVRRLIDRGWVARRPTGSNGRSWVATITPEGREALAAAHPAFAQGHRLLDAALRRRGVEPDVLRRQMQLLSATLRGLLPDVENRDGSADRVVATPVTAPLTPVRD